MLEFNKEHKKADLSTIKQKNKKVKEGSKLGLALCVLGYFTIMSGISALTYLENYHPERTTTAIIDNSIIVDLKCYEHNGGIFSDSNSITLHTVTGEEITVGVNSVQIIEGENSHEKAESILQKLLDENTQITYYDEMEIHERK